VQSIFDHPEYQALLSRCLAAEALCSATEARCLSAEARCCAAEVRIDKLVLDLLIMTNRLYGRSSEAAELLQVQGQLFAPPETIEMDVPQVPAPTLERTPKTTSNKLKQQPKREILPPNLPREDRLLDLSDAIKASLVKIGEDVSERLCYRPGTHFVERTIRPRYADPRNAAAGVQQIPVPASAIPGGILDESVIADIAINKFADHMPLSRQIERFGRQGVNISLSTISENLLTVGTLWLSTLHVALWHVLRQRTSLHVDETVLPSLPEPGSGLGQTQKTRLWTYLNDVGPPIILFHYTQNKSGLHVQEVLANWKDPNDPARPCYLHADSASNYEALYKIHPHILPVNCWAHARRKFYAIAKESKTRIFAHDAVEHIDVLFAYERAWKELSDEQRAKNRQTEAALQLQKIHTMLSDKLITLSPNTPTAGAISYLLKRWDNFTRYTARGDLDMSNNAAERALRKAALGRKNFLFVGNERGGDAAAIYYSLIETAKANGIEPSSWLLNAMRELPKRKGSSFQDVKDLLPIKGAALL
jgi:transposase